MDNSVFIAPLVAVEAVAGALEAPLDDGTLEAEDFDDVGVDATDPLEALLAGVDEADVMGPEGADEAGLLEATLTGADDGALETDAAEDTTEDGTDEATEAELEVGIEVLPVWAVGVTEGAEETELAPLEAPPAILAAWGLARAVEDKAMKARIGKVETRILLDKSSDCRYGRMNWMGLVLY